jgi:hypothetical protein
VKRCYKNVLYQKKLTPYRLRGFGCDNCGDEYYDEIAYSYAPSLNEINDYRTYCKQAIKQAKV